MSPAWLGFACGAVIGFSFTVLVLGLCLAARRGDEFREGEDR